MRRIIVASHGPLAIGIVASAGIIAGQESIKDIDTISVDLTTSVQEAKEKIERIFSKYDSDDELLALTDVYGGSITTVLCEYVGIRRLHIVTGINLGMLLETIFVKNSFDKIDDLIRHITGQAIEGINYVNAKLSSDKGEEI